MDEPEPSVEVTVTAQDAGAAAIRLVGELTEAARRPLVRVFTDLLLGTPQLRRVELDTRDITFINSAGLSALVQVQKMCQPRGVDVALLVQGGIVSKPLQLSGLWHRFTVIDRREPAADQVQEATRQRTEHG